MGTDIYLEWNEKTEAEDKQQSEACLTIAGGDAGYLRASIHMLNENAVLRLLFSAKYWNSRSKDEYDFKGNYPMLEQLAVKYILSSISGNEMTVTEELDTNRASLKKSGQAISQALKALEQVANGSLQICNGETEGLADAVEWLNSLFQFFSLGMWKQEEGLKPYPYISW
jgi:hypothetical protein